jgi:subtilisin family serine protease
MKVRFVVPALFALASLAVPGTAGASATGRALVLLERPAPGVAASARVRARAVIARHGLRRAGPEVPEVGVLTVRPAPGETFAELAGRLERDPLVVAVEREFRHQARLVPNDPAMAQPDPNVGGQPYQWYLHREHFPAAWDLSRGSGALVGVIDSGIDSSHPDLGDKVAIARDLDGKTQGTGDEVGHGTHVGGVACASTNNAAGISGAGSDCRLVLEKSDLTSASVIAALVDAARSGAGVINMSFGGGRLSLGEQRALNYALARDVVLIAAAADSPVAEQGHPAKDLQPTGTGKNLDSGRGLVVTAADMSGARASFAGRGSQISLAAFGDTGPGSQALGIFSSFPANVTQIETGASTPPAPPCPACRTVFNGDNRYGYLAGTSMAAPQVAGAVALVRTANPKLRRSSVVRLMKETASRSGGWSTELGWGILNAEAAVRRALELAQDTLPPSARRRGLRSRRVGGRFTLRWRGRDLAPPGIRPAGVESYAVYVKRGRRYKLVAFTKDNRYRYRGRRGKRYSFHVRARDRAGNVEAPPPKPDFLVRVRRSPPLN